MRVLVLMVVVISALDFEKLKACIGQVQIFLSVKAEFINDFETLNILVR